MKTCSFATILCALFWLSANAAGPAIDNRPAKPNEFGYRPAAGAEVQFNPPSLTWLHESDAKSYTVQWSRHEDFSGGQTAEGAPFNTYTHHSVLETGQYYWRYRFTNAEGNTSNWSVARRFVIPQDAVAFPMPTRAQQRDQIPKNHPRLFLRPEDLPQLRRAARVAPAETGAGKPMADTTATAAINEPAVAARIFAQLRAKADRLLMSEPIPEPSVRASARDDDTRSSWWSNREQAMRACQQAEILAWVYLITGEPKYGQAARKRILRLAAWDPDGPTNFRLNDEAAFPLLYRLPRAYDWAYNALTPADRQLVQQVMRRRALDAWESGQLGRGVGHLNRPFNSHANRAWHKLAECAIVFYGEIHEAEEWLDFAVNKFYACYPVWSDADGGWHEGLSYWAGYLSKAVWWLYLARPALDIDGFKKPFFAKIGELPIYLAPTGSPNMGFGDLAYSAPRESWGGFLEYFARMTANGHITWFIEQWNMAPEGDILGFLYNATLPPLPTAKPPTDLPTSKVFRGTGIASLHITLTNSFNDVHLLFKSSPFGSQSHGHNPQNSFQLNAFGAALLTTCVFRDWHGSKFHYQWCHSTRAHNAVLVDGQGQIKHQAAPLGKIADFKLSGDFDYVVGDATPAYAGCLNRFKRHIAFVKPDLIVVYDDLSAPEPASFQFMLHAFSPFAIDQDNAQLTVEQPQAGVTVKYLSPVPIEFKQWDGYDPKPERQFPNQWHVETSTQQKRAELGMLTVIVPHKTGCRLPWRAKRLETHTAIGALVQRGDKSILVAFRKEGATGKSVLRNLEFDTPVAVEFTAQD